MKKLQSRLAELHIVPAGSEDFIPVPEKELKTLERKLGVQLPKDYRWFLQHYGESDFDDMVCSTSLADDTKFPFGWFLGANESDEGVLSAYEDYDGEFPEGFIPISASILGDYYLLATKGRKRGQVYFWIHDAPTYENLDLVASSFTEFVQRLQPDDEND